MDFREGVRLLVSGLEHGWESWYNLVYWRKEPTTPGSWEENGKQYNLKGQTKEDAPTLKALRLTGAIYDQTGEGGGVQEGKLEQGGGTEQQSAGKIGKERRGKSVRVVAGRDVGNVTGRQKKEILQKDTPQIERSLGTKCWDKGKRK